MGSYLNEITNFDIALQNRHNEADVQHPNPPMNVSLTPELEQFVHDKVKSGRYLSASEVVREGLRLLEERDRLYQARLAELQAKLTVGIKQLDRGEGVDGETAIRQMKDEKAECMTAP